MNDLDEKLIYYYRNNFPIKDIMVKTGFKLHQVRYRIKKYKKQGILKRWWED